MLRTIQKGLGPGLILWYDLSNGKGERRLRVFENSVLRRIFGSKRDEMTGEWRKLQNEDLNVRYSSTNTVRVIKSRRMR
jgi:hypothetical protein